MFPNLTTKTWILWDKSCSLPWEALRPRNFVSSQHFFQLHNCRNCEISCGSGISNRGGDWHLSLEAAKIVVCLLVPARPSFPAQSLNWEWSQWTELATSKPRGSGLGFRKLQVFFLAWLWSLFKFLPVLILYPNFSLVEFDFHLLSKRREPKNHFHCPTLSSFIWLSHIYLHIKFFFLACFFSKATALISIWSGIDLKSVWSADFYCT